MIKFATRYDVRSDAPLLASIDVGLAKVPIIHRHRFRFPHFWRNGIQRREHFLLVIGMIGKRMRHNQQALLVVRHLDIVVLVTA